MSATAPRIASNAPDQRQLLVALGAIVAAAVLLVALAISRPMTVQTPAAAAAPAPVVHDHGWSETAPLAAPAHDNGWADTDTAAPGLVIRGTNGGGLQYLGIPYTQSNGAPDGGSGNGGNGTRFAR